MKLRRQAGVSFSGKVEVRQALDQGGEDQLGLEAGKLGAQAMVDAAAERHRPDVLAADIEPVGIGILRRIAVGRAQQGDDAFVLGQRHAADLDLGRW